MKLYEILQELYAFSELEVDYETGEIDVDVEKKIESLKLEFNDKIENIWKLLKNWDSEIQVYDAEIKRLNARKQVVKNTYDRLKNYTASILEAGKPWKSENGIAIFKWRKSTQCDIFSENLIDDKYIITTRSCDKMAIKNALKSGEKVDGAELVEKQNLVIK